MRWLLNLQGIHYMTTRFGWKSLRGRAFDARYQDGQWRFDDGQEAALAVVVRQYLQGGELLLMGCGGASILASLSDSHLVRVIGVDLSGEAIQVASRFTSETVSFEQQDMMVCRVDGTFDVILFSESLYYLREDRQVQLLRRLSSQLKSDGVFVVTQAHLSRHNSLLDRLSDQFDVLENHRMGPSDRWVVVCRPHGYHAAYDRYDCGRNSHDT